MALVKELIITIIVGAGLGEVLLRIASTLNLPLPLQEGKRPVFILGILLFSSAFRLLMAVSGKSKDPTHS